MTANFARSVCLAAYLTLTLRQRNAIRLPQLRQQHRRLSAANPPPKTNTDATFALLSKADTALGAAQPKRAICF